MSVITRREEIGVSFYSRRCKSINFTILIKLDKQFHILIQHARSCLLCLRCTSFHPTFRTAVTNVYKNRECFLHVTHFNNSTLCCQCVLTSLQKLFNPIVYLPVMTNFIDMIQIQLTDKLHQQLPIKDSKTIVTLLFPQNE